MAAPQFEFVSLADKAKQALDGISHTLSSSLLLLDDSFALVIRHSYGLAAFYRNFQPLNVLSVDIEPLSLLPLHSLHADGGEDSDSKHAAADKGDGWDEWQWEEKSEAVASTATSATASNPKASASPPAVTVLLSSAITPSLVSHIASVITTLRCSAPFRSSPLYVYSALSSQWHDAAGLSSYAAIEALLPSPASVLHLPLPYSLLLPTLFFLPSLSSLAPIPASTEAETAADVLPSLPSLSSLVKARAADGAKRTTGRHGGSARSLGQSSGTFPASSSASHISAVLTSLLMQLRLQPEVFSSGRLGHSVGQALHDSITRHLHTISSGNASRTAVKSGKAGSSSSDALRSEQPHGWQTASVVLVDRIHDMAAVCAHTTHVLDRMFYAERRTREEPASDVLSVSAFHTAVNTLHHSGDKDCSMLLNALVNESLPSVLRVASRLLASSSTAEQSRGRRKGDVDVSQVSEQVKQMEENTGSMAAHHGLYRMTRALVRAESEEADAGGADSGISEQWRQLQSLERICLSSLPSANSTPSESPLSALVELLQSPSASARSVPLLPLLALSSFLFSALGDVSLSATQEQQYRDALLHRVRADHSRDEMVARLVGIEGDVESFVSRSLTLLQQMRYARATFSSPQLSAISVSDESEGEPFVARLLNLCLDPAQSAADLEHHHNTELSAFDQLRQGAKESLKAAAALRTRPSGGSSGSGSGRAAGNDNVHQSLSSFLSLGSSVVNKVTSSLSSSMAAGSSDASHPSQQSTVVLVVLGDVSWLEVTAMLRVAALYPACNVLIGCTGIADPEEMAWKTFGPPSATCVGTAASSDNNAT